MDITLTGLIGTELLVYLNDVVIFADTLEEHKKKLSNLIHTSSNNKASFTIRQMCISMT